jgi:HK97 gp10 family phage protein
MSDLNRLEVDLLGAGFAVAQGASKIVRKGGQDVVRDAQAFAVVRTGAMKNSVGVDYGFDGLSFEAGPTVSYAPYIEFGTSRIAPRAFMGPAFDRNVPQIVAELGLLGGSVLE